MLDGRGLDYLGDSIFLTKEVCYAGDFICLTREDCDAGDFYV